MCPFKHRQFRDARLSVARAAPGASHAGWRNGKGSGDHLLWRRNCCQQRCLCLDAARRGRCCRLRWLHDRMGGRSHVAGRDWGDTRKARSGDVTGEERRASQPTSPAQMPVAEALPNTQMEPTRPTVLCDPVTAARGSFATLGPDKRYDSVDRFGSANRSPLGDYSGGIARFRSGRRRIPTGKMQVHSEILPIPSPPQLG